MKKKCGKTKNFITTLLEQKVEQKIILETRSRRYSKTEFGKTKRTKKKVL